MRRATGASPTACAVRIAAVVVVLAALLGFASRAGAEGVTNAADDLRDGWYSQESSLSPTLVTGGSFGQLWSASVEGQVYAQPLLANGTLLVATEANKVYGLNPQTGAQVWSALYLGTPWNESDLGCGDLTPTLGVTATPVIDTTTNTAYLTHKTYVAGSSGPAVWYLDAVNLANGTEKPGFPVRLAGSAQNAPSQTFEPTHELQRPGLLLMNGVVYAAFGSICDKPPWQGWVFGVSTSGQLRARWVSVASGNGAGIWQSGAAITSDGSGTILLSTGNGGAPTKAVPGSSPPANLGESVVRLNVQSDGSLKPVDFFAPFDASQLDSWDADFASGGVTALNETYFGTSSVPKLAVAVGKDGYVYLLNRQSLGGIMQGPAGSDKVVQRLGPYGGVWSRPAAYGGEGGWVYIPTASGGTSNSGSSGYLQMYQYGVSGTGEPTLSLRATSTEAFGFGTSAPVVTSEGANPGTALVWMIWMPGSSGVGAQLRAYAPTPSAGKPVLEFSAPVGTASKFAVPGVGAGRMYVGTHEGKVLAFGSPVTPSLKGSATVFPTTTIGHSSTRTLTLTANKALTVEHLRSSSSQFVPGTPSPSLPAKLLAGQTIQVPITFTPTQAGPIAGTLTVETSEGSPSFSMSGTGQSEAALLSSEPKLVSFGGTTIGGHLSGTATFRNLGGSPLTINAVKLPSAPFSAAGAPAKGATILPGGSVTVTVNFEPTVEGEFAGEIAVETTAGSAAVGLSGIAATPGRIAISPEAVEFGSVHLGESATRSFTVTNAGGTAVTVLKSKPPSGGELEASTTLAEGTTLAPGASVTETVAFKPTALGAASATWLINGNDTTGLHEVALTATGTPPPPAELFPPSITGTAQQGQTLTEHHGAWTNEPTAYAYQWLRCDAGGAGCAAIAGAGAQTYVPGASDVGHTLEVLETALNAGGPGASIGSSPTAVIAPAPAASSSSAPLASSLGAGQGVLGEKAVSATLASSRLTAGPGGIVRLVLRCPAGAGACRGTVRLRILIAVHSAHARARRRMVTLAAAGFNVPAGAAARVAMKLNALARATLARSGVLHVHVTISSAAAPALAGTLTLRAAPRRH